MWGAIFQWMGVAGAVMSGVGAYRQGKAARAAAEYNATIQRQNAEITREQTKLQVQQADREAYLRRGALIAAHGKSGGAQQGSVLDVLADNAAQDEIQRQDIAYRGALAERGFTNTATLDEFEGKHAEKQGYLSAGAELFRGGANYYEARERLRRT
jgi:hypothetical protein